MFGSLAGLDLVSLIEQESGVSLKKEANHWQDGPEYWGSCPFCGTGNNRFHVWPEASRPHYWCRVCGKQGSPPWFIKEYRGVTYPQALVELGLEAVSEIQQKGLFSGIKDDVPGREWLDRAGLYVHKAEIALRDPRGVAALDYLYSRGFTDGIIQKCKLGYMPPDKNGKWQRAPLEEWGLPIRDPEKPDLCLFEGIFIPWFLGDQVWKLEVRKLKVKPDDEYKIPSIRGSKDILYNCNAFEPGCVAVLCESATDAIAGVQTCADLAVFLATGGTKQAKQPVWVELLKTASSVLVAFDADGPGEEGADFWLKSLPNAVRSYPLVHDINAMLQAGMDIRAWLLNEMENAELQLFDPHATFARAYISQLQSGIFPLGEERPLNFGRWDKIVLDTEHLWWDTEDQCRGVKVVGDKVEVTWKGDAFHQVLAEYVQKHPEMSALGLKLVSFEPMPVKKIGADLFKARMIEILKRLQQLGMKFSVVEGRLHAEPEDYISKSMSDFLSQCEQGIIQMISV